MSPPDSRSALRTFRFFFSSFSNQHVWNLSTMCLSTHRHLSRHSHEENNTLMNHTTVDSMECLFFSEQVGEASWGPLFEGEDCTRSPLALVSRTPLGASLPPTHTSSPPSFPTDPQILSLLLLSTHFFSPEPPAGSTNSNCLSTFFLPSLKCTVTVPAVTVSSHT